MTMPMSFSTRQLSYWNWAMVVASHFRHLNVHNRDSGDNLVVLWSHSFHPSCQIDLISLCILLCCPMTMTMTTVDDDGGCDCCCCYGVDDCGGDIYYRWMVLILRELSMFHTGNRKK
jgi:hypothetical protein